jgi:hypothetical protein
LVDPIPEKKKEQPFIAPPRRTGSLKETGMVFNRIVPGDHPYHDLATRNIEMLPHAPACVRASTEFLTRISVRNEDAAFSTVSARFVRDPRRFRAIGNVNILSPGEQSAGGGGKKGRGRIG